VWVPSGGGIGVQLILQYVTQHCVGTERWGNWCSADIAVRHTALCGYRGVGEISVQLILQKVTQHYVGTER